jgi:parallel beta-helix repeat protein
MKKSFFKKVIVILIMLIFILSIFPLLSFSAVPVQNSDYFLVSEGIDLKTPAKPGVTSTTSTNTSTTSSEQAASGEFIFIDSKGTGDYKSIEEAVKNAILGSTIIIDSGTYKVPKDFEITKPINLLGKGPDKTIILGEEGYNVVYFSGVDKSFIEGITFTRKGNIPGNIISVENGDVSFNNCVFSGGKPATNGENWGSGLGYFGKSKGVISNCIIESNAFCGITIEGESNLMIINNLFKNNAFSAISYYNNSGGFAIKNECISSGTDGIQVQSNAAPTLIYNNVHESKNGGIGYFDNSGGLAFQNTCSKNKYGIYITDTAAPLLESNILNNNIKKDVFQE